MESNWRRKGSNSTDNSGMASNWRTKGSNMNSTDMSTATSSWRKNDFTNSDHTGTIWNWRSKDSKELETSTKKNPLSYHVTVPREAINLIIGHKGCNIKRMNNFKDVKSIIIDHQANKVSVTTFSKDAAERVREEISSISAKGQLVSFMKSQLSPGLGLCIQFSTSTDELSFKSTHYCFFDALRFCSLFGIDPKYISKDLSLSADHIEKTKLPKVVAFNEYWNTNMVLLDSEIIWNRHLVQSKFVKELPVTSNLMRYLAACTLQLNRLHAFPGVDYVNIVGSEEDIVLTLEIGARSREELEFCAATIKLYETEYRESLRVYKLSKEEINHNSIHSFCIPYACKSSKFLKKSRDSEGSFLDTLFGVLDVTHLELNEIDQTLTVGCTSEEKLRVLMFEVRGKMSFCKEFAWRKMYHGNFKCYIKVSDVQMMMNAVFEEVINAEGPCLPADFTDFVDGEKPLYRIKVLAYQESNKNLQFNPSSRSSFGLYNRSDILSDFNRFRKFVDLPVLKNVQVTCRFGVSLFKVFPKGKELRQVAICHMLNKWENQFRGYFSFDFEPSLKALFLKCLDTEDFKEVSNEHFTEIFFCDLGNNVRYTARIQKDASKGNSPAAIKYCKSDHMDNQMIDIDSSKCSFKINATSQKGFDNPLACEFVKKATDTGELEKVGVMSYDGRYSMYNVSIVDRATFQCKDFIINLDCVSKKSNQRYGRFATVIHLSLHSTVLNKTIHDLQKNPGDGQLNRAMMELFNEFFKMSEKFSMAIDTHFAC